MKNTESRTLLINSIRFIQNTFMYYKMPIRLHLETIFFSRFVKCIIKKYILDLY